MTDPDHPRFTKALTELATILRDTTLPPHYPELYWRLLQDRVSIEEWEYATQQAALREGYYHVPLPAHLLDYVREYRQEVA
jgi:hypothetical protein